MAWNVLDDNIVKVKETLIKNDISSAYNIILNHFFNSNRNVYITNDNEQIIGIINYKNFITNKYTLKELSKSNNLYIVSNCQVGYIEAFLSFYNFNKYFKDFECAGNTNLSKTENIKIVIERNTMKNPIYVGDTASDQHASLLNNIPYIYASYGFGDNKECMYTIDEFQDLKKLCYNLEKKGN